MHTYERPTIIRERPYEELTGLDALGPRKTLLQPQLLGACVRRIPQHLISGSARSRLGERAEIGPEASGVLAV
jgi:hypothetical protein